MLKTIHELPGRIRLHISALHRNPDTAGRLESLLQLEQGIYRVKANPATGRILIHYAPGHVTFGQLKGIIKRILALPSDIIQSRRADQTGVQSQTYELDHLPLRSQMGLTAVTGILAVLTPFRQQRTLPPKAGIRSLMDLSTGLTVISGIPLFRAALDHVLKKKLTTEFLAGTATLVSLFADEDGLGMAILSFMYLNTLIRTFALESIRDRIRTLLTGKEPTVRLVTPQGNFTVPGEQVAVGALFEVWSGERIPADGIVAHGEGWVNQFPALGQDPPQSLTIGSQAFAGSILRDGRLQIQTTQVGAATRIGQLIENLKAKREPIDPAAIRRLNQLSLLALGAAGGYLWLTRNLRGALNLLVIGMPGAAGLARTIPSEVASIRGAAHGALMKSGKDLASLGAADMLVSEANSLLTQNNSAGMKASQDLERLGYRLPKLTRHEPGHFSPSPNQTVVNLRKWQKQGHTVGLVGANQGYAPLLSAADVGIVLASGADWQLKSAGIILMTDDPQGLVKTARLARAARRVADENVWISTLTSASGYALACLNLLTPFIAGALQNLSTLAILANSSRFILPLPMEGFENNLAANTIKKQEARWQQLAGPDLLSSLKTHADDGLTPAEATARCKLYGLNHFNSRPKLTPGQIFAHQLDNYMSKVLLGLSGVSLLLGKVANAFMSSGVLLANTALAVVQENRTQKSVQMLNDLSSATAATIRGGILTPVVSKELVPGDIIWITAGDRVPADAYILESFNLMVGEAALTGEAAPVSKHPNLQGNDSWIFRGTNILAGKAKALVVYTGTSTQMGEIACMVGKDHHHPSSPVYRRLDEVGHSLVHTGLGASGLAVLAGLIHRKKPGEIVVNATSLAVSVIPDGLVPMITMALALGAMRLARRGIWIRQLPSVDTLGCINVLCADKTGTLTQNRQEVSLIVCPGEQPLSFSINKPGAYKLTPTRENLLRIAVLCNDATLSKDPSGRWVAQGDSVEAALLRAAAKFGMEAWQTDYYCTTKIPFTSETMRMTSVYRHKSGSRWVFAKGAPEVILKTCRQTDINGTMQPLSNDGREDLLKLAADIASKGLKVLAFAYQLDPDETKIATPDEDLIFAGYIGVSDPLRPEAALTINACRKAGVKVLMLTGDHQNTALAIGEDLGLVSQTKGRRVLTGDRLAVLTDEELDEAVKTIQIYARMTPAHKQRLIEALKRNGETVAMLGDGINDAPAIGQAHAGMSMGRAGTGLTRQMAPIILADDNLAMVPEAIKEGRVVYDNIRKCLRYSLATNLSDGVSVIWTTLLGKSISIQPEQLLWVNLTSDPLISWVLANDTRQPGIDIRPPRRPEESIFSQGLSRKIVTNSLITGLSGILVGRWSQQRGDNPVVSQSLSMATSTLSRMWQLTNIRRVGPLYPGKMQFNPYLAAVGSWMLLPIGAAIYIPWLQPIFKTSALRWRHWQAALIGSTLGFAADTGINYLSTALTNLRRTLAVSYPPAAKNKQQAQSR